MKRSKRPPTVWSESDRRCIQRDRRAEAARALKREHQEQGNVKRSKIAGGLERSDISLTRPI